MLTYKRHQLIIGFLTENDIVTVNELMERLKVSESTIRRDLNTLEQEGRLVRIHGGAKKISQLNFEASIQEKKDSFHEEKVAIARYCAQLIKKEDIVYLDAGSTTFEMIPFIANDQALKVITNSVEHAAALVNRKIDTIILGGSIKLSTNATLGAQAITQLRQMNFNKAFLGMNGVDLNSAFTTPDPEEAAVKKIALQQSQRNFILVDHSKFQQKSFVQVAPLKKAEIITDRCPEHLLKAFQNQTYLKEVEKL
ncbi:MAG TPA: DeoR/GlpR family DNA-binding transcription regulator [Tetragenococcus sp.]|nr:DeoR/GlpR family DNA-binding transcription regulator [Tetragenococcus sp.]